MFKKFFRDQDGVVIVLFALGMTVFLGFLALVVDVGRAEAKKFDLSNAVDAAALAGAQELPNTTEAAGEARICAALNGVDDVEVTFFDDNEGIRVHAERTVNMLFAGALGVTDTDVGASAAAIIGPISATDGVIPLGIEEHEMEYGTLYTLKVGAGSSETGWFGALALGGPGADTYRDNMKNGYQGKIKVNDPLDIETGNMSNPTKEAIDVRMAGCHHSPFCGWVDSSEGLIVRFERDCTRLVKVPVVVRIDHDTVKVKGFAVMLLEGCDGQGNECYVKGRFVQSIIPGEVTPGLPSYGATGVRLVE